MFSSATAQRTSRWVTYGIKLQPPDTDERTAEALYFNNLALIAAALPFYLEHQHQGIHPLRNEHPFWAFALRAGFSKLPYAPMIPGAVPGLPNAPSHTWLDRVQILSRRL